MAKKPELRQRMQQVRKQKQRKGQNEGVLDFFVFCDLKHPKNNNNNNPLCFCSHNFLFLLSFLIRFRGSSSSLSASKTSWRFFLRDRLAFTFRFLRFHVLLFQPSKARVRFLVHLLLFSVLFHCVRVWRKLRYIMGIGNMGISETGRREGAVEPKGRYFFFSF